MVSEVIEAPAVFDPTALSGLTGHTGDDELARVLVRHYLRLLPLRLRRLLAALEAEDPDTAMDAVLSLKVSSRTLGARELGALAAAVERQLRLSDLPGAYAAAASLAPAAGRVERVLLDHLAA